MNALIALLCFIWGFNFVIMKLGNDAFSPVMFAALRFFTGAIVLFSVCFIKKIPLPNKSDFKWYFLCGLLQTTYFNIAIQISLNYISVGLTAVLTYSMPLFLSIMAHRWIPGEKLTPRKTFGIALGIIGLILAMNIRLGGPYWAIFLALSSAISWAAANLLFKLYLKHCDNIQYTFWQMAIGAVGLLVYSLSFEHGESHWGFMPVVYILFSGIVASAFGFVIWNYILSRTEACKASISLLLVPIIGVISGCIFFHENLKISTSAGILLTMVGIWIINSRSIHKTTSIKARPHSLDCQEKT